MVYQMTNPWTPAGRNTAIQKAVGEIYDRYFARGPRWIAKHLPQRRQMPDYASQTSPESREILLGDFGIEYFIEDYAQMAIQASGDSVNTRHIYTQWVYDETRHSKALWYSLTDSGLYSQKEMDEYAYQCGQDVWTFERQTGHEATPERGAAYAIGQERQTKRNYQDLQKRLWREYGAPKDAAGRPEYPAIAGVCGVLAVDEGFHEGVFREITRVYLRFWPDKALQAIWDVYERYRMPIVKLPNAEAFLAAVLSTGIDSARQVITDVLNPTYAALGLENRAALRRAARESWDLPEGAVIQVGDELLPDISEDAIPYRMNPNGSLVPAAAPAA
ncbi:MAG: acyl-ACP desaturase [Dehalococcoidia bacterium]